MVSTGCVYAHCGISESWGLGYLEEFKEKKKQKGMHDKKTGTIHLMLNMTIKFAGHQSVTCNFSGVRCGPRLCTSLFVQNK